MSQNAATPDAKDASLRATPSDAHGSDEQRERHPAGRTVDCTITTT